MLGELASQDEKESRALFQISLFVLAVHLLFVIWTWWDAPAVLPKKEPQKLVVKTISLSPKTPSKTRAKTPIEPLPTFDEFLTPVEEISTPLKEPEPIQAPPKTESVSAEEPIKTPSAPATETISSPKPKASSPPKKKKEKAVPKKKTPPPVSKKETPPKKKPETPKPQEAKTTAKAPAIDKKKQALLAKAQESIAKIQASGDKIGSSKAAKRGELKVPQFQSTALVANADAEPLSGGEIGYRDELASRLQLMLKMPEAGQVKLKLTLNRQGKFVKLTIVTAESLANRKYIEKTVPTMAFPAFGNQFGSAADYTFSITLNSDL
jgi:colicin import membrane protein